VVVTAEAVTAERAPRRFSLAPMTSSPNPIWQQFWPRRVGENREYVTAGPSACHISWQARLAFVFIRDLRSAAEAIGWKM
jgi:hypothetical protein